MVKHISDRVLVMYLGHAVELGTYDEVYHNPLHPYTGALMSAVPIPDPDLEKNKTIQLLEGELPSPINPPSGCVFRTRCPIAGQSAPKHVLVLEEFQTRRFLPESRSALKTIRADSCQPFFTLKAIIYSRQMIWQSL